MVVKRELILRFLSQVEDFSSKRFILKQQFQVSLSFVGLKARLVMKH